MATAESEIAGAVAAERELLSPGCRGDPRRAGRLLAADFSEVGASGRVWDRGAMLAMLAQTAADIDPQIDVLDMRGRRLAAGLVLVTYLTVTPRARVRRASIWRSTAEGWQVVYHQGTPVPAAEEGTGVTDQRP